MPKYKAPIALSKKHLAGLTKSELKLIGDINSAIKKFVERDSEYKYSVGQKENYAIQILAKAIAGIGVMRVKGTIEEDTASTFVAQIANIISNNIELANKKRAI